MNVVRTVAAMREWRRAQARAGRRVALVPTMGALHQGHLSLVDIARRHAEAVAVSIFVNPTQFAPNEDLDRYPRDEAGDLALCEARGVDVAFCPDALEVYPSGASTFVEETQLSRVLCGVARPCHFRGVATVVVKLFAIVEPAVAVFGRKDAQQVAIVKRVTRDLFLPVDIVTAPIVRDSDGVALSSRNRYLSHDERRRAVALSASLRHAEQSVASGETSAERLVAAVRREIEASTPDAIDYVELLDAESLEPVREVDRVSLMAVAARYGATRLIDNVLLAPGSGALS